MRVEPGVSVRVGVRVRMRVEPGVRVRVRVGMRVEPGVRVRVRVGMRVEPGVAGSSSSLSALPAESRAASASAVCSRSGGWKALTSISVSEVRRTLLTST
jgi:hypothetical protein